MNLPGYHVEDPHGQARADRAGRRGDQAGRSGRSSTPAAASSAARPAKSCASSSKKTGIPVTMTVMGLGAFPGDDPLSLDMLGMHGSVYANYAVDQADLLIALGVRFDDRVTGKVEEFCQARQDRPRRHRSLRAQQEQAGPHPDVQRREVRARRAEQDRRGARRHLAPGSSRCQTWKRDEPFNYDQKFAGILQQHAIARAVEADARPRTRSSPSASASIRCGPPSSTSSMQPRTWLSELRPGHDGLRPARGDGRAEPLIPTSSSSISTATAASR